jgi:hypothetical protein
VPDLEGRGGRKDGHALGADKHFDAAGETGLSPDKSGALEREHHPANRWRAQAGMALDVNLGR